jgi:hypothetical protein
MTLVRIQVRPVLLLFCFLAKNQQDSQSCSERLAGNVKYMGAVWEINPENHCNI